VNQKQLPQPQAVEETREKGRIPDFKSDGVAVWVNKDKNGKDYVAVLLVGHNRLVAFKNEPKA
jgi:hypothetical protein